MDRAEWAEVHWDRRLCPAEAARREFATHPGTSADTEEPDRPREPYRVAVAIPRTGWGRGPGGRVCGWGHARSTRSCVAGRIDRWLTDRRLAGIHRLLAQVEPVAHIVQSERIGHRLAIAQSLGGVEGLERLVDDPGGDEDAEDPRNVAHADQHGEDHDMDQPFEELAVVHGADAGDEAENPGSAAAGLGRAGGDGGKGLLIGLPGAETWLAEDLSTGSAVRVQPGQRAFPQFWQNAVAVTPG